MHVGAPSQRLPEARILRRQRALVWLIIRRHPRNVLWHAKAAGNGVRILDPAGFPSRVQELFDKRAKAYDAGDTFHLALATELLRRAAIQSHEHVLDLATGTGMVALGAADVAARVVGVDLSPNMVAEARAKSDALRLRNCSFEASPVESVALPLASFDVVLCSSAMIYFADVPAVLRRIRGWLKPGGRLVFNTPQEPCIPATLSFYRLFAAEFGVQLEDAAAPLATAVMVESALGDAGFCNVTVSTSSEQMLFGGTDAVGFAAKMWNVMLSGNAYQPVSHVVDPGACDAFKAEFLRDVSAAAESWQSERGVQVPYTLIWATCKTGDGLQSV